jgi:hypothetical protein
LEGKAQRRGEPQENYARAKLALLDHPARRGTIRATPTPKPSGHHRWPAHSQTPPLLLLMLHVRGAPAARARRHAPGPGQHRLGRESKVLLERVLAPPTRHLQDQLRSAEAATSSDCGAGSSSRNHSAARRYCGRTAQIHLAPGGAAGLSCRAVPFAPDVGVVTLAPDPAACSLSHAAATATLWPAGGARASSPPPPPASRPAEPRYSPPQRSRATPAPPPRWIYARAGLGLG